MIKKFQLIVLLTLCLSSGLLAQEVILSDEFDAGDGKWTSGWIDASSTTVTVSIDTNEVLSGKNSYLLDVVVGGPDTYRIQRNANCPLLAGYVYNIAFLAVADRDVTINVLFEIAGDPYTKRLNELPQITTTPQVITYEMTSTENVPDNQLKLHFGGPDNNNYKIWIDSVVVTQTPDPALVDQWGLTSQGKGWPILNTAETSAGDGSLGGTGSAHTAWSTIRGGFDDFDVSTTDKALVVRGKMEFVGGGPGDVYTGMRYAITYLDSATLNYQYTDSASWDSPLKHYGYEFTPKSGKQDIPNGSGGQGMVWTVSNGNWNSTYSNGGVGPLALVLQAPRYAEITEGNYDWAISVHQVSDTTNEIRWSLVKSDNKYWFAGSVVGPATTTKFNGVCFGLNEGDETQFNITWCKIDKGDPIPIPEAPWEDYYVTEWGFIGNRIGGWTCERGYLDGDVILSGENPPTDWSAVRGGFYNPVELKEGQVLIIKGDLVLEGGGFQDWSSLRLGMFYSESAGTTVQDSLLDSSWVWTGTEGNHSGYLFLPHSGSNDIPTWSGTPGTYGAIVDGNWISTNTGTGYVLGTPLQVPSGAVAGAAKYAFQMGVQALEDGSFDVRMQLRNGDNYIWEAYAIDANNPLATNKFNCICFAINNKTTTAMTLEAVQVTKTQQHIVLGIDEPNRVEKIPTEYTLSQNYPNPFNPSTTIKFGLPAQSDVKLVVYDVLGRVVAELQNKKMSAGYHEVMFNASSFSSGIYYYRIEAGDFVEVKRMLLLK